MHAHSIVLLLPLLTNYINCLPTEENLPHTLTSPGSARYEPDPAPALDAIPPFRTDVARTQTHILMKESQPSQTYPKWNPSFGIYDFLRTVGNNAAYQAGLAGGSLKQVGPIQYVFPSQDEQPLAAWRWRVVCVSAEHPRWSDIYSAVDVVAQNIFMFQELGKGYHSVDVRIGRVGTRAPEDHDALAYVKLWYGVPNSLDEKGGVEVLEEGLGVD